MRRIRQKIEQGGERLWRYEDFHGFSFPAVAQALGQGTKHLKALRTSLNPLLRFDFGLLSDLSYAMNWQAKGNRQNETV